MVVMRACVRVCVCVCVCVLERGRDWFGTYVIFDVPTGIFLIIPEGIYSDINGSATPWAPSNQGLHWLPSKMVLATFREECGVRI